MSIRLSLAHSSAGSMTLQVTITKSEISASPRSPFLHPPTPHPASKEFFLLPPHKRNNKKKDAKKKKNIGVPRTPRQLSLSFHKKTRKHVLLAALLIGGEGQRSLSTKREEKWLPLFGKLSPQCGKFNYFPPCGLDQLCGFPSGEHNI
ncbi:hypothetical protein AVEN_197320-1 [Araneus ventricosus]|uniref:Uncharacterized protein n=1 Tax=Araneus ventricosus TaxID=182803 RepID=A0A4Y2EWG5_ARAVE|nr:hypothetical protein AVEN_197320-1 [Araneus ventricosus]